jgi:hypothetical protein
MSALLPGAGHGMGVPPVLGGAGTRTDYSTPRAMLFVADDVAAGELSDERALQLRRDADTAGAPPQPVCCSAPQGQRWGLKDLREPRWKTI